MPRPKKRSPERSTALTRILLWLERHAPRTRASLVAAVTPKQLADFMKEHQREAPLGFAPLYCTAGGQKDDAPSGLFRGYTFMRLRGVDGVETAWERMFEAASEGAPWATKDRYAFAKDFGGNYLCVDMAGGGRVNEIEEGKTTELAQDMEAFLTRLADDLEAGRQGVDDALIDEESFEVVFDAGRERTPGERVKHSVFETLGLEATVESLADHASAFDRRPYVHGFYVRMVPRAPGVGVGAVRLDDERGRPVSAECGHSSGGGRPGFCVFVQSALEPIPQGSRLVVELVRKRRV